MYAGHRQRVETLALVDRQIEALKERLRVTHEEGMVLVREVQRLEREKQRYLIDSVRPTLVLLHRGAA